MRTAIAKVETEGSFKELNSCFNVKWIFVLLEKKLCAFYTCFAFHFCSIGRQTSPRKARRQSQKGVELASPASQAKLYIRHRNIHQTSASEAFHCLSEAPKQLKRFLKRCIPQNDCGMESLESNFEAKNSEHSHAHSRSVNGWCIFGWKVAKEMSHFNRKNMLII